jgi:hypothetical protein
VSAVQIRPDSRYVVPLRASNPGESGLAAPLFSRRAFLPRRLLGQEPPPQAGSEPEPILGAPAAFEPQGPAGERRWLPAGTRLRREPDLAAASLTVVDAPVEAEVIERRGAWVRVRLGSLRLWALVAEEGSGADRGEPSELLAGPAARSPDAAQVARGRGLLRAGGRTLAAGPFALHTDLADERLLADLGAVAANLEAAYRERLALEPLPAAGEAVLLFSREEDYRAFSDSETTLEHLDAHGHAGNGLAALALGDRPREETRLLLVHELVHLLNRRTLGADLPPWLEEGLAEDLAFCRVDSQGRLRLGTLAGDVRVTTAPTGGADRALRQVVVRGPRAALGLLADRLGEPGVPSLAELVELPWSEFVEPGGRDTLYPLAGFFVRYLFDGAGGRWATAFRSYLATLAAGERPDPASLAASLGTGWAELQPAFATWTRNLAAQTQALGSRDRP